MINLNLRENQNIAFDMNIDGAIKQINSVSIVIESGSGYDIRIPAAYADGVVNCEIPILEGLVSSGEKNLTLELVVDGKIYTPLKESVMIEAPLKVEAKSISEEMISENIIPKISIGSVLKSIKSNS